MNAAEYVIMGGLGVAGPEKLAIVCGDERLTYGALTARVSQFAAGLREAGLRPDHRVAILMRGGRPSSIAAPGRD
jgi:acyl-CoA synthetase (AMP-forming)/AMP-acid ligase II